MRAEKQNITVEYLNRLNASPFFIVVDYKGLKVGPITELRKRLSKSGAEMHVVKNSIFKVAVKEAGLADLGRATGGGDGAKGCVGRGEDREDLRGGI
jgi:large subunit ribosomal protein L10